MENNDVRVEESSKLKFIILRRNHYCFFFTTRPLRAENSLNERPSEARGPNFPGIFSDFADDARFHFKMKICQMPTGRLRIDCMRLCPFIVKIRSVWRHIFPPFHIWLLLRKKVVSWQWECCVRFRHRCNCSGEMYCC